jgi:hypothetical protein
MGKPKTAPQKPKAASLKSKEEQKPKAAPSEKKKQEQKPKAAPLKKQKPKAAPLKKQEPKDVPLEKQKPKKELPKDVPLKEQEPKTKSPEKQKPLQSRIKKPLSGVKDFKPLKVQKVSSDTQKRFITIPDSEILAEVSLKVLLKVYFFRMRAVYLIKSVELFTLHYRATPARFPIPH